MVEGYRPISNTRTNSLFGKAKFYGRLLLDLQILTIFRDVKTILPVLKGQILDVGCGQSPYRYLLDESQTVYKGIDIVDANVKFNYRNSDIIPFDGEIIPFSDSTFDAVLCTEVLEHVARYQQLVDEIHRVLKPDGQVVVTVPWSARYHYIPFDFFRYTPSALRTIFSGFSVVDVRARGSDISVIANKFLILWVRNFLPRVFLWWIFMPVWVAMGFLVLIVVVWAHLALLCKWGSPDDPLGYTVIATK